jgi:hypothetical protein
MTKQTHNKPNSSERASQQHELGYCTCELDSLHARMQTNKARQAVDTLFSATDAALNRRPYGMSGSPFHSA